MTKLFKAVAIAALTLAATACTSGGKWSVSGTLVDAAGKTVVLESVDNGRWQPIDSATIADDGSFKFKQKAASYPDIYRLTMDGRSLYFPIDSIDNVTIEGNYATFDHAARISGSESADMMQRVNDRIASALSNGVVPAEADSLLKRDLAIMLQNDWGGIVAYYTINKTVGNGPLFDPANSFDRKIISAVANAFYLAKPGDPRSEMLKNMSLSNRRMYDTGSIPFPAVEVPFIEISLRDKSGQFRSLTEEWQKDKVMVLNFTVYGADESPAFNAQLQKVYSKFADKGMEIYQVVCDEDEYLWLQAAKNVPWISVYNVPTESSRVLMRYNVTALPTTFVIDRAGDNIERVDNVADLETIVAKYI